jgi:hypothetical protein
MSEQFETLIERRPDSAGRSTKSFPEHWGQPPASRIERRKWINAHSARDLLESRGQRVPWLEDGVEWE